MIQLAKNFPEYTESAARNLINRTGLNNAEYEFIVENANDLGQLVAEVVFSKVIDPKDNDLSPNFLVLLYSYAPTFRDQIVLIWQAKEITSGAIILSLLEKSDVEAAEFLWSGSFRNGKFLFNLDWLKRVAEIAPSLSERIVDVMVRDFEVSVQSLNELATKLPNLRSYVDSRPLLQTKIIMQQIRELAAQTTQDN